MALTTVNPSQASGMCRSESSTSKFSIEISLSASLTVAAGTTSNPWLSKPSWNAARMSSLSSASRILCLFIVGYTFQIRMTGNKPVRLLNYGHRRGLYRSVATSSLRSMPPLVQQLRGPHEPPQELSRLLPARRPGHRRHCPASPRAPPLLPAPGLASLRLRHHRRRQRHRRRSREAQTRRPHPRRPGPCRNARSSHPPRGFRREHNRRLRLDP